MIPVRNRLILDAIFDIIKWLLKIVYKVVVFLNMQLPLLVVLVGIVLYLVGLFDGGGVAVTIYVICLVVSVVIAIIGLIKKLLGLDKETEKTSGVQIVENPQTPNTAQQPAPAPAPQVVIVQQPAPSSPEQAQVQVQVNEQPQYFRLKQNPNYVMAEYPDRYELFKVDNGSMVKVRTDYK